MTTEQQVYDALIGVGFSRSQAAGIMGNLQNESGFNVEIINPAGPQAGVGLAQWQTTNYPAAASYVTGHPAQDLARQVRAIVSEARHLNLTGTAGEVAGVWASQFEKCAGCQPGGQQYAARVANAERIYQQAVTGKWPAPSGPGVTGTGPGGSSVAGQSATPDPTGPLAAAGALLHDVSLPVAWFLEFWQPGQGWRLAFGAGTVVAGIGGVTAWRAASADPDSGALPLAVGLFGLAALGAFMTLRAWPVVQGKAERPAAYVTEILQGRTPAAGPQPVPPVSEVEVGLTTLFGLWAASKIASGVLEAGGAVAAAAGLWGKIRGWLGDVGKAAGDIGAAAEVP